MSRGKSKSIIRRQPTDKHIARPNQKRPMPIRILVVCDGLKTEPFYFSALKEEPFIRNKFHIKVKQGKGGSAVETVRKALTKLEESANSIQDVFDKIYCIIDVEGPDQVVTLQDALREAENAGIIVCLSNPSFECWYLAHFERISRSFNTSEIKRALNRKWQEEFKKDYRKQDSDHYTLLKDKTSAAIDNASNVRENDHSGRIRTQCNSSTEVYKLVSYLLNPDNQSATP